MLNFIDANRTIYDTYSSAFAEPYSTKLLRLKMIFVKPNAAMSRILSNAKFLYTEHSCSIGGVKSTADGHYRHRTTQ